MSDPAREKPRVHSATGVLVWGLALGQLIGWGTLYFAFALFMAPMEAELGWSRADLNGALTVGLLTTGLASIPCGWWMDRFGPHLVMTAGALLGAASLLLWSTVSTPLAFYLVWVGIGLATASTVQDLPFAIASANIARLSPRHRLDPAPRRAVLDRLLSTGQSPHRHLRLAARAADPRGDPARAGGRLRDVAPRHARQPHWRTPGRDRGARRVAFAGGAEAPGLLGARALLRRPELRLHRHHLPHDPAPHRAGIGSRRDRRRDGADRPGPGRGAAGADGVRAPRHGAPPRPRRRAADAAGDVPARRHGAVRARRPCSLRARVRHRERHHHHRARDRHRRDPRRPRLWRDLGRHEPRPDGTAHRRPARARRDVGAPRPLRRGTVAAGLDHRDGRGRVLVCVDGAASLGWKIATQPAWNDRSARRALPTGRLPSQAQEVPGA